MFSSVMFEARLQAVLFLVEAAAYLALAVWCLNPRREGQWSLIAGIGAGLAGLVLGLYAVAYAELRFLDSAHVYNKVLFHQYLGNVLEAARALGALLLAAGFVRSRRTPPAPSNAIYGS